MELVANLKRVPNEIFIHIWSYTYSPQPANLLEDIRDYPISLEYVLYFYQERYDFINDYMYWIIHDIFGYISFFSYDSDETLYTSFWKRAIQCSNMDIDTLSDYIYRLEQNKIETQVRLLWAMLYPSERVDYLDSIETFIEDEEEDYDF